MRFQVIKLCFWKAFYKKDIKFYDSSAVRIRQQHVITSKRADLRGPLAGLCLLPLLWIFLDIALDNLGSNAIQALHIRLGDWALRFLCITLAVTPVQRITRWSGMAKYRQLFGLCSFFYATLHILAYMIVDHAGVWSVMFTDVIESPFIWFGLFAYSVLFLLAVTSHNEAKRKMGKNWKKLHRWIYPAAIAAVYHYFWQLKGNLAEPFFYAVIIFILLAFRILFCLKERKFNRLMIPKSPRIED